MDEDKRKQTQNSSTDVWAKQNKSYFFRACRNYTIRVRFE